MCYNGAMKKGEWNRIFTDEIEKQICDLYLDGNTNSSVALGKMFGCHFGTILNVLRRNGIAVRDSSAAEIGLQTGANHPMYKGGNISPSGYKRIKINGSYIFEHRHFMEQSIGRKLTSNEVVHHINHDKLDNRLENLQLMTRREHMLAHREEVCGKSAEVRQAKARSRRKSSHLEPQTYLE